MYFPGTSALKLMPTPSIPRGFWSKLWSDNEETLRHFITDAVSSLCTLAIIEIFWEGLRFLKFRGYDPDKLEKLDNLHFAFVYLALAAIGIAFLLRLVALLWNTSKKR
jgi:hypothetical protein